MSGTPDDDRVDIGTLGSLKPLGSGGQGTVHVVAGQKINNSWPAVFKEYKPEVMQQLDQDALAGMVHFLMDMSFKDGNRIFERAAWPWRLVSSGDSVAGFLMRRVPDEYNVRLQGPQGPVEQLAQVQHLLNNEKFLTTRGIVFDNLLRLELLRDIAETLVMFHSLDIAVGNLSPRNLLFSARTTPRCFFIDCDAMRLRSTSALAQAETPEWMIPDNEELATAAADMYKFSLLAIRLFAGDQFTRDTTALATISPELADLAQRGLSENPAERCSPQEWVRPLVDLIAVTQSSPTQVLAAPAVAPIAGPPPLAPAYPLLANPLQKRRPPAGVWIAMAVAVAVLLAIAVPKIFDDGTSNAADNPGYSTTTYDPGQTTYTDPTGAYTDPATDTDPSTDPDTDPSTDPDADPSTDPSTDTGPTDTDTGTPDAQTQAQAFEDVITTAQQDRAQVSTAIRDVGNCSDLADSVSAFQSAADGRQTELNQVQALETDAIDGADAQQYFAAAMQDSINADQHFLTWAKGVSTHHCSAASENSSAHTDAESDSALADTDKNNFVQVWDPIADQYGFTEPDPKTI